MDTSYYRLMYLVSIFYYLNCIEKKLIFTVLCDSVTELFRKTGYNIDTKKKKGSI